MRVMLLFAYLALVAPTVAHASVSDREVTIDFSSYGFDKVFDPDFYRSEGIRFPSQRCGSAGCDTWFVGFFAGDAALVGNRVLGGVQANFSRPISDLSLNVAPALQGTATYTLTAFSPSGEAIATTSTTVTQDTGDPAHSGFGFFTISLTDLPSPAKSFTLNMDFVRSSFHSDLREFGVSSISYVHWGGPR